MSQDTAPKPAQDPVKRALVALEKAKARITALENERSEPIAIVGMGCRLPGGADSPQRYWELLERGGDGISEVPADRWDLNGWYDPDPKAPGKMYTRRGGFVPHLDSFDAEFFGIAPPEAQNMDPQQRLLLELSWEALEHAGEPPDALHSSATGVFVGLMTNDYAQLAWREAGAINPYTGTGSSFSVACGRLSYVLGLRGPSMTVDTACSSTLVAIHLACQSLRQRECNVALAGGVNRIIVPGPHVYMCKMGALSPDGRCWTFDERANGYARGEGGGMLVLKRLSDALAAGDTIHALIRGSAVNHDGQSAGLTAPAVEAQEEVLRRALASAGVEPGLVGCIEAHGTGTPLGDPIEVAALKAVYARPEDGTRPCALASVKSSIGHLEAAAGAAAVIKMVHALRHGVIPAHTHFSKLNPKISLDGTRLFIPGETRPWPEGPRFGAVSGFGFGGTNAHLILEAAPTPPAAAAAPGDSASPAALVLPLSARSEAALAELLQAYRRLAGSEAGRPALADACYTAAARRTHHPHRAALLASDWSELVRQLDERQPGGVAGAARPRPRIAFVFSGQGGQWAGMGRSLLAQEPVFREAFEACERYATERRAGSLREAILEDPSSSALARTDLAQPAIFALQWALLCLWRSWGVQPDVLIGHSVGEIAVAVACGALSLREGMHLAIERGRIMQEATGRGAMASVPLSREELQAEIDGQGGQLAVAAVNGPNTTVVAGDRDAVQALLAALQSRGVAGRDLGVSYAFHSRHMEPFGAALALACDGLRPAAAHTPAYSTLTGRRLDADSFTPQYWARQMREPVLFAAAVQEVVAQGIEAFVEIGPQPTLAPALADCLMQAGRDAALLASIRTREAELSTLRRSLGQLYELGVAIDWRRVYRAGRHVELPTYPWQRQRYWLDVQAPAAPTPAVAAGTDEPPLEAAAAVASGDTPDPAWAPLVQRWKQAPLPGAAVQSLEGSWLVLSGCADFGRRLAAVLEQRGAACVTAGLGRAGSGSEAERRLQVDPADAAQMGRLLGQAFGASALSCRGIVYAPWGGEPSGSMLDQTHDALAGLAHLVQSVARAGFRNPPRLWVVTQGGQSVEGEDVAPAQAALGGLVRALAHEQPELGGTVVDVPAALDAALPGRLADEFAAADSEQALAWRGELRWVARVARFEVAGHTAPALRPDASYLVSGGPRALDAAEALADRGVRSLVLAGSWRGAGPRLAALRGRLERLEVLEAEWQAGDTLSAWLRERQAQGMAPLRGCLHIGTPWQQDASVLELDSAALRQALQAELLPAVVLQAAVADLPLDFFVVSTPAAALLGSPGQAAGLASAAAVQALADRERSRGRAACGLAWGPATELEDDPRAAGEEAVPAETAVATALACAGLSSALALHLGLFPLDLRHWRQRHPRAAAIALLRDLEAGAGGPQRSQAGRGQLRRALEAADPAQRRPLLEGHLKEILGKVALLDPGRIGSQVPLVSLGLDSFMGVELRNRLEAALDLSLSPTLVYSYPTVAEVATHLAARMDLRLGRAGEAPTPAAVPGAEAELDSLSDETLHSALEDEIAALEQSNRRTRV
ncbi:beta-ketoacyl synthase N-terminal-like domain-containing protein [Aquabacterium sp. A7-Y]|uniref:type I polyketide synthase n=1 Tax=Aquabacterium sp. A7-Y TaxID=1349605 RepID=UPI00223E5EE3|nr:type I polyketide synthase [Aquabacterium sp. A7-Y]MCW7540234.1 beta-ketoacyl synthase N-terminal-like domain-containing protein [Aquabacterium sp. A7-Y]